MFSKTNSIILDLIRFLCSQGVLLGHLAKVFGFSTSLLNGIASYCVILFFILSGLLISNSLRYNSLKSENYRFRDFFISRFLRIYPPFLATLVLVFITDFIGCHVTGESFSFFIYTKNLLVNIFQLQEHPVANVLNKHYHINFFYFPYLGSNLPLWTISIEWWLYMFYGFGMFYIFNSKKLSGLNILIFIVLSVTPLYYLFVHTHMDSGLTLYWFLGALISPLLVRKPSLQLNDFSFACVLIMILCGMYGFPLLGYHVAGLLFFMALFILLGFFQKENTFINKWLEKSSKKLASYSYSLYLIHYPVLTLILKLFTPDKNIIYFLLLLVTLNLIAFVFAFLFETKFKTWYENYRSVKN